MQSSTVLLRHLIQILLCLSICGAAHAQVKNLPPIRLQTGQSPRMQSLDETSVATMNKSLQTHPKESTLAIFQFDHILSSQEKDELAGQGIRVVDYLSSKAYIVLLSRELSLSNMRMSGVARLTELTADLKLSPDLADKQAPDHAVLKKGMVDVVLYLAEGTGAAFQEKLKAIGCELLTNQFDLPRVRTVRVPQSEIMALAGLPEVLYVQPIPGEKQPIGIRSLSNSRANLLKAPSGLNLNGSGVVIGVGDNANLERHVDLKGRYINHNEQTANTHGVFVSGIVAGGGIADELGEGYAPGATIISQFFSKIIANTATYVKDYGMAITNNSYGPDVNNCANFGTYDIQSAYADYQAFQFPQVQHVFAAGNSGAVSCPDFPTGYGNVLSTFQVSKNVLTVGNTTYQGAINSGSSKGPSRDGRIKPEIVAQGTSVYSALPVDTYGSQTGTSFASPAAAGGLTLMYQHYRTAHGGLNPKNGLMKALLCNGATDLGNPGPDFQYGFGWLNLDRALGMLDANQYLNDSIANGSRDLAVNIPAGTAQAKIMLYWNDPYANPLAASSLVNDLDLSVISPSPGGTTLPLVLSTNKAQAAAVAAPGEDHVNNIEQVVLNNPASGIYTIRVNATEVVTPRQEFFVVYDFLPQSFKLTYPVGGERIAPGDVMNVSWNVFGTSGTFDVSYSADNGGSWTPIVSGLAATARQTDWTVPALTSKQVLVKVKDNTSGVEQVSASFIVLPIPVVSLSSVQCEGYIALEWPAVSGATDYEIMVLEGRDMVSKGTTASASYVLSGLSPDSVYYVAVRGRITGTPARRSIAVKAQPNTGTCAGAISNNDLRMVSISTPASSGRLFTSSALSATQQIKVNVKNLDDAATSTPFDLHCQVNSGIIQTLTGNSIATGGTITEFTFPTTYDFSGVGTYNVKVWITSTADLITANNELTFAFRQLPNDPVSLPFTDNFDALTIASQTGSGMGVLGTTRYDLKSSEVSGRIRSYVSDKLAFSQPRAITLDNSMYQAGGTVNEWIGTYNLDGRTYADDIRLDFAYKNHGAGVFSENKVWIRGQDSDPWIEVYDLGANQLSVQSGYKMVRSLEITRLLFDNSKTFSKSFQIRWGVKAKFLTADAGSADGYSFDNVSLYTVTDDVQLISITAPDSTACTLGNMETVTVKVYNSSNSTLSAVPIKLKVDALTEITENIPSIPARGQVDYTFTAKADLSAPGAHLIKVTVAQATDSYPENNVGTLSYYNAPVVSAFPYLQDFESGNGFWHAAGTNSSWQYGTPASSKIDRAASGTKAWKTNLAGSYNSDETSYLYSPCFMIGGMANPTLSLSLALDLESCDEPCDRVVLEYSQDGTIWQKLGTMGTGTNWYNKSYSGDDVWSVQGYERWHVATSSLPTGLTSIRFRFVMKSDPFVVFDGIAIDDIHVYDKPNGIYNTAANSSVVSQTINASSGFIHFTDGGKLIASIDPLGQALGNTQVQAFVYTGTVRNASDSYYLNRNITVKPATTAPASPVKLRLYFLDTESEALLNASGCTTCPLSESAYELNVTQYTNTNKSVEDGNITNNSGGTWAYHDALRKVPFDQGYYVDFQVAGFSEFWFGPGDLTNSNPLPVKLTSFTAKKDEANTRIEWATTEEVNASHFEIQVAGEQELRDGQFRTIGSQPAKNTEESKTYLFVDTEAGKAGTRYYRLKMVDLDGTFAYSKIQSVYFPDQKEWVLYPNPSSGNFYVVAQASEGAEVSVLVRDVAGHVVSESSYKASGNQEKFRIDAARKSIVPGIYHVEVMTKDRKQSFKIVYK